MSDNCRMWCEFLAMQEEYRSLSELKDAGFSGIPFYAEEIVLPDGIMGISDNAFRFFKNLKKIKLPKSLVYIGRSAFAGCSDLEKVVFQEGATRLSIWRDVFAGTKVKKLVIPSSVEDLEFFCDVEEISLSTNTDKIRGEGLSSLKKVTIRKHENKFMPAFSDSDLFKEYFSYQSENLTEVVIDGDIKIIGKEAFSGCSALEKVTLPKSLTKIQYGAFRDCKSLKKIDCGDAKIELIEGRAFSDCSALKSFTGDICHIGKLAFKNCKNLNSINLGNRLESIADEAFCDCENLEQIELPDSLLLIGDSAFSNCEKLKEIRLPKSLTEIPYRAFFGCSDLKKVVFQSKLKLMNGSAFLGCSSLEECDFSQANRLKEIGGSAFKGCKKLRRIEFPKNLKTVGEYAFADCDEVAEIILNEGLVNIYEGAFENTRVKEITFPKTIRFIGMNLFGENPPDTITIKCDDNSKFSFDLGYDDVFPYMYIKNDISEVILKKQRDKTLEDDASYKRYNYSTKKLELFFCYKNCRKSWVEALKQNKKDKRNYVPPFFLLEVFPSDQLENFYVNKNHSVWRELVQSIGFDTIPQIEKENAIRELLKIYYALGGFSKNIGERDRAADYIKKHIAKVDGNPDATPKEIGREIHRRFSGIELDGEYSKEFAKFFMMYYCENPDFMVFTENGNDNEHDYLCQAHNHFKDIIKLNPYMRLTGNTRRVLLTPKLVADLSCIVVYNFKPENSKLAKYLGRYGYSQNVFDMAQEDLEYARTIKDEAVFQPIESHNPFVNFRVLAKDDEYGFIIGNISACCQHYGGAAESCVRDGFLNKNSGFIVFETGDKDEDGNATLLAQAYMWYDPITKTVCFDNIEAPDRAFSKLESKELFNHEMLSAIKQSAYAILFDLNKRGIDAKRLTVGKQYGDLNYLLEKHFEKKIGTIARNRSAGVYTDAAGEQYKIATIEDVMQVVDENDDVSDFDCISVK